MELKHWFFFTAEEMSCFIHAHARHVHAVNAYAMFSGCTRPCNECQRHARLRCACPLGCSDFHIFSQSCQVSPIPAFFRTLVFRKYQKKDCHFCHLGRILFYFFKNLYFFRNFQNQFSKSVFNQSSWNFEGIIFDK